MIFKQGEKVALMGGGMLSQDFYIVTFLEEMRNGEEAPSILGKAARVKLDTSGMNGVQKLPNPFTPFVTTQRKGLPLGGSSWHLKKLESPYDSLKHGKYCFVDDGVIDVTDNGYFSPLSGPLVLDFNDPHVLKETPRRRS